MRGKVAVASWATAASWITPAHAGKRPAMQPVLQRRRDHPRPCGEKGGLPRSIKFLLGSPPPMRGKAFYQSVHDFALRITPAHAGKSRSDIRTYIRCQDHPRPCGEKLSHFSPLLSPQGSPPPMRGKAQFQLEQVVAPGITPAHAGKSTTKIIGG